MNASVCTVSENSLSTGNRLNKAKESKLLPTWILLSLLKIFDSLIHSQSFTQIAREVRVKTASYCHVIRQELQRDNG